MSFISVCVAKVTSGRDKPDVKVKFVKRSYETNKDYLNRIQHECDNVIKMTNATKQRNMAKEFIKVSSFQIQNFNMISGEKTR